MDRSTCEEIEGREESPEAQLLQIFFPQHDIDCSVGEERSSKEFPQFINKLRTDISKAEAPLKRQLLIAGLTDLVMNVYREAKSNSAVAIFLSRFIHDSLHEIECVTKDSSEIVDACSAPECAHSINPPSGSHPRGCPDPCLKRECVEDYLTDMVEDLLD